MKTQRNIDSKENIAPPSESNFSKNFSETIRHIFSKKVTEISPKLDYFGIFEFLENEANSQIEKENFIKNLEKIDLENILPILENENIKDFHKNFIEKLDGIELSVEEKFFQIIPTNKNLLRILKSDKIFFDTLHTIFRTKNYKKFPLDHILPYTRNVSYDFSRAYLINRFVEEQNWDNIKTIIPKITDEDESFIITEILTQMNGFVPFSEIRKFLESTKTPHNAKVYLSWKCENNLDKNEILPFIEKFGENLSTQTIKNLLWKTQKNLSLEEWRNLIWRASEFSIISTESFVILDPKITDAEIDTFLETNNFREFFKKSLLPYREKNFKNISRYGKEKNEKKEDFSLGNFFSNSWTHFQENLNFVKNHLSAYKSDGSMIETFFIQKMKHSPNTNIYDLYRETAKSFLSEMEIHNEDIREKNNKNLVNFQKKFLSEKELQDAKNAGIDTEKFELTLYIRYEHMVNFPKIADMIAVFIDEYIANWHSKYFSNIRILPRNVAYEVNIFPLLKSLKTVKYYNTIGLDAPKIMNIFASCMYFSHSANVGRDGIPNIISSSMKPKNRDIQSFLELESRFHDEKNLKKLKEISTFEIYKEIFNNLKNLENNLDELLKNKNPE